MARLLSGQEIQQQHDDQHAHAPPQRPVARLGVGGHRHLGEVVSFRAGFEDGGGVDLADALDAEVARFRIVSLPELHFLRRVDRAKGDAVGVGLVPDEVAVCGEMTFLLITTFQRINNTLRYNICSIDPLVINLRYC